jgi:CopG family transcriptional regulator/antitoxin EndoAI
MATSRVSRVYTISLPPELARKAEAVAKLEERTMSDLFRESFRAYLRERFERISEETAAYVATLPLHGYTEEDVPQLVKEVRAEMYAEKMARAAAEQLAHAK